MWMASSNQLIEGLKRKKKMEVPQERRKRSSCLPTAVELELWTQFFPGSPVCWDALGIQDVPTVTTKLIQVDGWVG